MKVLENSIIMCVDDKKAEGLIEDNSKTGNMRDGILEVDVEARNQKRKHSACNSSWRDDASESSNGKESIDVMGAEDHFSVEDLLPGNNKNRGSVPKKDPLVPVSVIDLADEVLSNPDLRDTNAIMNHFRNLRAQIDLQPLIVKANQAEDEKEYSASRTTLGLAIVVNMALGASNERERDEEEVEEEGEEQASTSGEEYGIDEEPTEMPHSPSIGDFAVHSKSTPGMGEFDFHANLFKVEAKRKVPYVRPKRRKMGDRYLLIRSLTLDELKKNIAMRDLRRHVSTETGEFKGGVVYADIFSELIKYPDLSGSIFSEEPVERFWHAFVEAAVFACLKDRNKMQRITACFHRSPREGLINFLPQVNALVEFILGVAVEPSEATSFAPHATLLVEHVVKECRRNYATDRLRRNGSAAASVDDFAVKFACVFAKCRTLRTSK